MAIVNIENCKYCKYLILNCHCVLSPVLGVVDTMVTLLHDIYGIGSYMSVSIRKFNWLTLKNRDI